MGKKQPVNQKRVEDRNRNSYKLSIFEENVSSRGGGKKVTRLKTNLCCVISAHIQKMNQQLILRARFLCWANCELYGNSGMLIPEAGARNRYEWL